MKKDSTSLIIRETQAKTTVSCHLHSVRMASSKRKKGTNVGKDLEKEEHLYTVGGHIVTVAIVGKM